MRVTGGNKRGHRIEVPIVSDLRPSQDVVRESVFNILGDINNSIVLDIYAGTGVLGIEALSRGARFCDFVDQSKEACRVIENNLRNANLRDFADVYCEKAESFVMQEAHQPYNIIFLDPPYASRPRSVIRMLPNVMNKDSLLIYLHGKTMILEETADREWVKQNLNVVDTRKYGATHVTMMQKIGEDKPKADNPNSKTTINRYEDLHKNKNTTLRKKF